jgi:hypothetical protein
MITKIRHQIIACSLCCGAAAALTACSDFLDILPMNDVVLENYYTEKSDVASVLNGCYESLESSDCLTRMALWGEVRSDNLYLGSAVPWELEQVVKENILPSNSYCKWAATSSISTSRSTMLLPAWFAFLCRLLSNTSAATASS